MTTLLSLIFIAAMACCNIAVAQSLPDLKGRTIHAVTENAYIPLNFIDPSTQQGIGWEYDAMNEIGKRLNAKIKWHTSNWDTMIQAVKQGQYDIGMDGITITEARAKQVSFSEPYMTSEQFMLVRANESRFNDAQSFAANKVLRFGVQPDTTNFHVAVYDVLDGNENNPRITLLKNFGTSIQALKSGRVDAILMDAISAQGYMDANPDAFKIVGKPLGIEKFGFIFPFHSDLLDPINLAIKSMKMDGTLEGLNKKWFFDYCLISPSSIRQQWLGTSMGYYKCPSMSAG